MCFLEKPIAARTFPKRNELIALARAKIFVIHDWIFAALSIPSSPMSKRSIEDGTIGQPVSALVSRHHHAQPRQQNRRPHQAFACRHGGRRMTIDFILWCFRAEKAHSRLRTASEQNHESRRITSRIAFGSWLRWDDGCVFTIGAGLGAFRPHTRISPRRWIEMVGTEGAHHGGTTLIATSA